MKLQNTVGKQITTSAGIRKIVDRKSRLISRRIKKNVLSLKNPNHIKKIYDILPEIMVSYFTVVFSYLSKSHSQLLTNEIYVNSSHLSL